MMQSLIRVALFFIFLSRHNDGGGWHACLEDFVARAEEPDREREPEKNEKSERARSRVVVVVSSPRFMLSLPRNAFFFRPVSVDTHLRE